VTPPELDIAAQYIRSVAYSARQRHHRHRLLNSFLLIIGTDRVQIILASFQRTGRQQEKQALSTYILALWSVVRRRTVIEPALMAELYQSRIVKVWPSLLFGRWLRTISIARATTFSNRYLTRII